MRKLQHKYLVWDCPKLDYFSFDGLIKRCPSQKENVYSGGWRSSNLEILTKLTHVAHLTLNGLYSSYYYFEEAQCGPDLIPR